MKLNSEEFNILYDIYVKTLNKKISFNDYFFPNNMFINDDDFDNAFRIFKILYNKGVASFDTNNMIYVSKNGIRYIRLEKLIENI